MRTEPIIGEKAWFGPRRLGWGLEPSSPEGWAVTILGVVLLPLIGKRFPNQKVGVLVATILFIAIPVLKGTSPGGPKDRKALQLLKEK